jgi:hypothetical protein
MTFGLFIDSDLERDSESFNNYDFKNFDFTNNSTASREVFTDPYDGVTDPEADKSTIVIYHQIYVIARASRQADEASEAFDDLGNPYVDPADLTRGSGNKYIGTTLRKKCSCRRKRGIELREPWTVQNR